MKLIEMFKRQHATDDAFRGLEDSLNDMITVELAPPLAPSEDDHTLHADEPADEAPPADEQDTTAYTAARIAEYTAFETMVRAAQADTEMAASLITKIKVAQHHTREYLNSAYSSIHRANELELTVTKLADENRVLRRQTDQIGMIRGRYESLSEAFRKREAKLTEAADALRQELSALKLESVELNGRLNTMAVERQESMNALAATNLQLEGASRENEMLREKQVNLIADNDQASRKRAEAERRTDELLAIHARDAAEIAEMASKLAASDAERQRLQKQYDTARAALVEATDTLGVLQVESGEQAKRYDASLHALRAERDSLLARSAPRLEVVAEPAQPDAPARKRQKQSA